jgi:hypothetical protein
MYRFRLARIKLDDLPSLLCSFGAASALTLP